MSAHRILTGKVVIATHNAGKLVEMRELLANWTFPALQQAGVRYRWNGEETYGMLERSIPKDQLR